MRIVRQREVGPPSVFELEVLPDPTPQVGEVVVKVAAAGVNPIDLAVRSGAVALGYDAPFTVGWDIAGEVVSLGEGMIDVAPGDRVFGMPRFPRQAAAYADLVAAPAAELARTPSALADVEAGALPLAGLTAWQALVTAGGIVEGQRVLVHAGAGGVGHLAVQIAKALGAHVTTTVSAGKVEAARGFGADEVIDYAATDVASALSGIDLVLETRGGPDARQSVAVTREGGRVVSLKPVPDDVVAEAARRGVAVDVIRVVPSRAGLEALARLAADGRLKVHVARTFPLADAAAAHAFMDTRPVGKLALVP